MDIKSNPGFLLHKIGSMMERSSDQVLFKEFGVGYSQFKIMFALSHHSGAQQKEIAEFLGQTEASISRQIKLLKQAHFVSMELGSDDKKKHHISLTGKGQQLLRDALAKLNLHYEPILSILSEHDQQQMTRQLAMIHDKLLTTCEIIQKREK